ncbi:hypothetical protein [Parasitella parasitica]|uniref:IBB domain-containing protein n=1 Tax=Parasitella parasitica TaxID=35722 RepID=A0A0B7NDX1_9FUNG|nr:hypothetical protein [Parasitella parasitica]
MAARRPNFETIDEETRRLRRNQRQRELMAARRPSVELPRDNRRGQSRLEAQRRRRQRQAAQFDTSQDSSDSEGLDSSIADNSDVDVDFDSLSWENVRSKYEVDIRKGCTETLLPPGDVPKI